MNIIPSRCRSDNEKYIKVGILFQIMVRVATTTIFNLSLLLDDSKTKTDRVYSRYTFSITKVQLFKINP